MHSPHPTIWHPDPQTMAESNIQKSVMELGLKDYRHFYRWSIENRSDFWTHVVKVLGISMSQDFQTILDISRGIEHPAWLRGARLNIVDSCFQNHPEAPAMVYSQGDGSINHISQRQLESLVNRVANGLMSFDLKMGDRVAIDMPMTAEAVAIYLAAIKAGFTVVTIADSFSPREIATRLEIAPVKVIFTQDHIIRKGKQLPLLDKIKQATDLPCVVIPAGMKPPNLETGDQLWSQFLSSNNQFEACDCHPHDPINILFSSGTTGHPKAIPWDHTTPIKAASDGYYHQDIKPGNVVCWPTNLGWMMGPWLVFATLINKGTVALYHDAPYDKEFGNFIEKVKVNILGVVPSLVAQWKATGCMETCDWSAIRCFSSTGECSNAQDMAYLMALAGHKPVIEYCGGTEIGGAYVSGTMVQPSIAATFSSPTLGTAFTLMDDSGAPATAGEVFLLPPTMGLSTRLLNRDHHQEYFANTPTFHGQVTRRHGDQLQELPDGYYRALGRVDDSMNLGGIKVSSVEIEEVVNQLDFVRECSAIAVSPAEGGPSQLVLYLVIKQELGHEKMFEIVNTAIRSQINPLFKLRDLKIVPALPRTASNKVMRRKLREDYLAQADS